MQEAALDMVERKSSPLREAYAEYISSYLDKNESGNTKVVHQLLFAERRLGNIFEKVLDSCSRILQSGRGLSDGVYHARRGRNGHDRPTFSAHDG
jgi:hypothetical protein